MGLTRFCVRGIRGATTVKENKAEDILKATAKLLQAIVEENNLKAEDIASVIFTVTPDLNAEFPATATREFLGWKYVPLICGQEINVPDRAKKCIRVLIHVNTDRAQDELKHIYQNEAVQLREDLI